MGSTDKTQIVHGEHREKTQKMPTHNSLDEIVRSEKNSCRTPELKLHREVAKHTDMGISHFTH